MQLNPTQIELLSPRLVEMEIRGGLNLKQMAESLGLTTQHIRTIRKSQEYQEYLAKTRHDAERNLTQHLRKTTVQIRERLSDFTEEAIETVYRVMTDIENDAKVRLSAACEILDRDGRFAKVSRMMNVRQGEDGAPMLPEDAAAEIVEALEAARKTKETIQ